MKSILGKFKIGFAALLMIGSLSVQAKKKVVKISVVPSDAQISVDGNYVGDGVVEVSLDKSDFIAIKLEKEGYITQENKFYRSDKRSAISYTMRPDKFYEASVPSGLVNKFFSVTISPEYYTTDKNGKRDADNRHFFWIYTDTMGVRTLQRIQTGYQNTCYGKTVRHF